MLGETLGAHADASPLQGSGAPAPTATLRIVEASTGRPIAGAELVPSLLPIDSDAPPPHAFVIPDSRALGFGSVLREAGLEDTREAEVEWLAGLRTEPLVSDSRGDVEVQLEGAAASVFQVTATGYARHDDPPWRRASLRYVGSGAPNPKLHSPLPAVNSTARTPCRFSSLGKSRGSTPSLHSPLASKPAVCRVSHPGAYCVHASIGGSTAVLFDPPLDCSLQRTETVIDLLTTEGSTGTLRIAGAPAGARVVATHRSPIGDIQRIVGRKIGAANWQLDGLSEGELRLHVLSGSNCIHSEHFRLAAPIAGEPIELAIELPSGGMSIHVGEVDAQGTLLVQGPAGERIVALEGECTTVFDALAFGRYTVWLVGIGHAKRRTVEIGAGVSSVRFEAEPEVNATLSVVPGPGVSADPLYSIRTVDGITLPVRPRSRGVPSAGRPDETDRTLELDLPPGQYVLEFSLTHAGRESIEVELRDDARVVVQELEPPQPVELLVSIHGEGARPSRVTITSFMDERLPCPSAREPSWTRTVAQRSS